MQNKCSEPSHWSAPLSVDAMRIAITHASLNIDSRVRAVPLCLFRNRDVDRTTYINISVFATSVAGERVALDLGFSHFSVILQKWHR
jgi:hypothetical protein